LPPNWNLSAYDL